MNGACNMKSVRLLLTSALCLSRLFGQADANAMRAMYGPPIEETFSLRPGITLTATYGDSHQVCKLDIRPSRNDVAIPAALIEELVNEIVPPSIRGTPGHRGVFCSGFCWKMTVYDKMSITQAVDDVRPNAHDETRNSLAV